MLCAFSMTKFNEYCFNSFNNILPGTIELNSGILKTSTYFDDFGSLWKKNPTLNLKSNFGFYYPLLKICGSYA